MDKIGNFTEELISFYTTFFDGLSKSIKILSDIQAKHKDQYLKIKEAQSDPSKIYSLIAKINDEERRILLDLMMRANILQQKGINMFDLSVKEQQALSTEIEKFSNDFTELLKVKKNAETD